MDNEKANKSISETDQKAQGLGGKLASMIGTAAKWGAAITGAAVAGGTALFGMATKAAGTTDRIDKLSQKIGISRQGFQEWEFILSQSGTDIEKLQVGLKTMVQRMDETAKGTGQGARMFDQLGISVTDATGAMKSQEQVFEETVRALQNMPEGAEKSRLAFELFGKAGMELMPLLNGTNASLDDMQQMAKDLGLVLSDEAVDAGVAFTDAMDQMKRSLGAVVTNIGAAVIPIFLELTQAVIDNMPLIQSIFQAVFGAIEWLVRGFIDGLKLIISWVSQWASDNSEQLARIQEIFTMFFEAAQGLIAAFVEFATAFWAIFGDEIMAIVAFTFEFISNNIDTALKIITEIFNAFSALFRGDWKALGESIKRIWGALWDWLKSQTRAIYNIGKDIIKALWDGIKDMWSSMTRWVGDKVKSLASSLNPFKSGGGISISGPSIPAMAAGGTVLQSGMALVGERGPELLQLPRGATVAPLGRAGITFERGAFEGAMIMDDYGVDRLMDRIKLRATELGVV